MSINQKANVDVTLNNEQAKHELEQLQQEMKKLISLRDKATQEGNIKGFQQIDKQLKKATREAANYEKQLWDVNNVMRNISGSSLNDLRKAQSLLTAEISKMDRKTAEYASRSKDLKAVKAEISAINDETKVSQSLISRIGNGFNNYMGLFMAVGAGLAGVSMAMKSAIQSFNDYQERVSALSSLTGLMGDDLKYLSDQAKELATSTLDGGVLVTNGSQDIVDAFTKVGSARPELLKNKEALVEVTKNAMILSSASKEELKPSIAALTMVMNQYNVAASESRRIINTIAAGSKEGAGEIPYITAAFEKAGTVASDAGISIETLVATIETLAPRITAPEIAGRSLKGVLLDLQNGADDTNPAIVGMTTAFENLAKKNLSATELTKMFGVENITTAKILINNVGELKKYEAAVTGTNVAIEQGAINTATNNARLAQARERFNQLGMQLGEKLGPAYAGIISKASLMLKSLVVVVDFFIKYSRTIMTVAISLTAYAVAIKVAANWTKIQTAYTVTAAAVEKAYAFTKGVLTGQIKLATVAQKGFNLAMKSNPIGLIVGLIAGAVTWLISFDQRTGKVSKALSKVGEFVIDLANSFIDLYNSSMPIRVAVNYIVAAFKTGFAAAKLSLMQFLEPVKLAGKLIKAALTFDVQGIKDAFADFAKNSKGNVEQAATSVADTWSSAYNNALSGKLQHISNTPDITVNVPDEESSGGPLENRVKAKVAESGKIPGLDRETGDDDETAASSKSGKGKGKVKSDENKIKDQQEKELKALEEKFQQRQYLIEKQHIMEQDSETSFLIRKGVAEQDYLEQKKALLEKFGLSTSEVDSKLRELELNKLREQQEELKTFQDDLMNQFQEKLGAEAEKEKQQQDQDVENTLKYGQQVNEYKDYVVEKFAETEDEKLAILEDKRKEGLITEIEYEKEVTRIHAEAEDARQRKTEARFEAVSQLTYLATNLVNSMMELELQKAGDNEEKKNTIRKKYAGIQYASAVASIIVDTAGAIMKGYQQLGPILGSVSAVLLAAIGAVQIANANAQKNALVNGFAEGGYTGPGRSSEPAGIVHKGEYVIPSEGVSNPALRPLIDGIEVNRRQNRLATMDVSALLAATAFRGYASGGFVTPFQQQQMAAPFPAPMQQQPDPRLAEALDRNTAAMQKILEWKPKVYTELIKKDLDTLDSINKNRNL